jgi:TRAP-type uncharacterized transport system substrate-binding protein
MTKHPDKRALRDAAKWFYAAAVLLILGALAATIVYLGPFPPRVVMMSTGTPGGAYDEVARRYRTILARSHVDLRLVPSAGAVENLKRLGDPRSDVSVGLVQNGLTTDADSPDLVSLGTISYEPLWLFYRGAAPGLHLEGLRGRKVSIGPEGSGSRAIALELLSLNGIGPGEANLLPLPLAESGEQLLAGKIDATFLVTSWDASIVRRLLADSRVELANFARANAYLMLDPSLNRLTLPAGVGNLAADRPPADVTLLAPKSSLVVRGDLHPAIQYLLLDAATEVHSGAGVFHKSGQFPAAEQFEIPLSPEARQFYKSGRPFLQRYLPFWLAVLVGRLLVLSIPVIGVAYPLLKLVPAVYDWSMRRRVFRLYGELRSIELEVAAKTEKHPEDLLARLDRLQERANHLRLPSGFADLHYTLRQHIDHVKAHLRVPTDSVHD